MKTSKLIAVLLIMMTISQSVNAQDTTAFKSKYNCWIYNDTLNLKGVIYSVADSGINFAASISISRYSLREDDRQLQYIPVSKIDYIDVRKKGKVGRGALIGSGIGGVFSFALLYTAVKSSSDRKWTQHSTHHDDGLAPSVFIGGFTIAGAVIGALIGSQKLEFQINRKQNRYKRQKEELRSYAIIQ